MKYEEIETIELITDGDFSVPNGLPILPLSGLKASLVDVNSMSPATIKEESALQSLDTTVDNTPEPVQILQISRLRSRPRTARRNINAELAKTEEISETVASLPNSQPVLDALIQTAKDTEDELSSRTFGETVSESITEVVDKTSQGASVDPQLSRTNRNFKDVRKDKKGKPSDTPSLPIGLPEKPPVSVEKEKTATYYFKELLSAVSAKAVKSDAKKIGVHPGIPPEQSEFAQDKVTILDETYDISPVSIFGRFTPLGLALDLDYYQNTDIKPSQSSAAKKMEHKSFVCSIENLQKLIDLTHSNNLRTFGVVVIVSNRHAVPVMFHMNEMNQRKAYVIESYGYGSNTNGTLWTLQIAQKIHEASDAILIHTFKEGVQRDLYSCGTIALKILKQSMRMLEELDRLQVVDCKVKPFSVKPEASEEEKNKVTQTNTLIDSLKDKVTVLWFPVQFAKYTQAGDEYAARMAQKEKVQKTDSAEIKWDFQLRPQAEVSALKEYLLKEENGSLVHAVHFDAPKRNGEIETKLYNMSIENARRKHAKIIFERMANYKYNISGLIQMLRGVTGAYLFLNSKVPAQVSHTIDDFVMTFIQSKRDQLQTTINNEPVFGFPVNPLTFVGVQQRIDSAFANDFVEEQREHSVSLRP